MSTAVAGDYAVSIREAIRVAWPSRDRAKRVAGEIKASHRTVEDWTQGRRAPSAEQLLELMATSPAIEETVAKLVAVRRAARVQEQKVSDQYANAMRRRAALAGSNERAASHFRTVDRRMADPEGCGSVFTVTRRRA